MCESSAGCVGTAQLRLNQLHPNETPKSNEGFVLTLEKTSEIFGGGLSVVLATQSSCPGYCFARTRRLSAWELHFVQLQAF
ncbi:hypothetical protein SAMN06265222_11689 [Neorhodopirellula lusitana]|uniref:Uncharacterized protein n=1 Tax=Neorhodopirellula lusitana TaxID=445327 RepID=A0ABY1QJK4_9BACT|nr:hypothetical protein SAMN06265222_11689 [Neorhodopirellula lusitana]